MALNMEKRGPDKSSNNEVSRVKTRVHVPRCRCISIGMSEQSLSRFGHGKLVVVTQSCDQCTAMEWLHHYSTCLLLAQQTTR
eukprot:7999-Heterococcus_DN1.PRE.2